jgi:DNA-binding MarR family transcriptional regulator
MDSTDTQNILRHWRDAVPHDRLAHLIKDASRSLVRALQLRLTEHNVSFGHWAFLRILWEEDGLAQHELSQRAGVAAPTTFAAMKAMERLGYVERRHLPDNKKNLHVYLTGKGRALKAVLVPLAEEVNVIGTRGLKESEVRLMRKALVVMIGNLAEDETVMQESQRYLPSTRELSRRISNS